MAEQSNQQQVQAIEQHNTDIAVVGAGPAGLSFALCLAKSGLKVTLIDQQPLSGIEDPALDGRDIAMNHLSKCILTELGVWQRFAEADVHPLKEAKVMDGHFKEGKNSYALHFERTDDAVAPLGYLVANNKIRLALYQQVIEHDNIELLTEHEVENVRTFANSGEMDVKSLADDRHYRISASMIVAADSRFSVTRRMMGISARMKDYGRVMIVCNMEHELSHENTAQECFQYGRTCAILPLGPNQSSIVITTPSSLSHELVEMDEQAFNREVEKMLAGRLGKMKLFTKRFPYPLVGAFSNRFVGQRFALIGDAAVGMHPVTAHGYNLGLRSADTLATQIIKAQQAGKDIASSWVLHNYEARHMLLSKPIYEGTNAIVQLYTDDHPLAKVARKVALRVGNNLSPFKKLVTQRLIQER